MEMKWYGLPSGRLLQQRFIAAAVAVPVHTEDHPIHDARMAIQPRGHGLRGDLSRPIRREAEHPRGDAAKGHGLESLRRAQPQYVFVACGELLFVSRCQRAVHDGSHDMDHMPGRQIIAPGQHGDGRRLLVVIAVLCAQRLHLLIARQPQLDPGKGVDAVPDPYQNHT